MQLLIPFIKPKIKTKCRLSNTCCLGGKGWIMHGTWRAPNRVARSSSLWVFLPLKMPTWKSRGRETPCLPKGNKRRQLPKEEGNYLGTTQPGGFWVDSCIHHGLLIRVINTHAASQPTGSCALAKCWRSLSLLHLLPHPSFWHECEPPPLSDSGTGPLRTSCPSNYSPSFKGWTLEDS